MNVRSVFRRCLAVVLVALALPLAAQPSPEQARVIVKLRAASTLLTKALPDAAEHAKRADGLGKRAGIALDARAGVAERVQVVEARGLSSEALAQRLAADPDVEYAVPDRRRRLLAAPNDPLYGPGVPGNGPAVGQWYLRSPVAGAPSSIDVETAWAVTSGSGAIVVAVLDTGVRFDHPDLGAVGAGGVLLPGYDMVTDLDVANDGDGRDADASDPGDWLTAEEIAKADGAFHDCEGPSDSSWHGTMVSGIVAARANNGAGMAGIASGVRVLPVRVLGKCGGYDSDIIAGMRWAVGAFVPGVPTNPYRARVINMSLGSESTCSAAYRDVIRDVNATGAVVVAAAGNSVGHAVQSPANCDGVIAVAALRHVGTKVGFSDLGPEIALSAPGGNCVNTTAGSPCLYPILTATTTGTTIPGAPTYTDSYKPSNGTSFSSPLVAGTAALMLSARPSMSPAEVKSVLQATARPFPIAGADPFDPVPACTAPQFGVDGKPVDQSECVCTTSTCGAGMLDAGGAVRAAQSGMATRNVIEFHHAGLGHYFISAVPDEIRALDEGTVIRGWVRTGGWFRSYAGAMPSASAVCRFYIPPGQGDSHFFGRGVDECAATGAANPTFVLEDRQALTLFLPVNGACPADTTPVYRAFNGRRDVNHRYMTDPAQRDAMVAGGWIAEGDGADRVVMCAPR